MCFEDYKYFGFPLRKPLIRGLGSAGNKDQQSSGQAARPSGGGFSPSLNLGHSDTSAPLLLASVYFVQVCFAFFLFFFF